MEKQPMAARCKSLIGITMAFLLSLEGLGPVPGYATNGSTEAIEDAPPPHHHDSSSLDTEIEDLNDGMAQDHQSIDGHDPGLFSDPRAHGQKIQITPSTEEINQPHPKKRTEAFFHACDACSRTVWRAFHPVFGWLSVLFNGASTVTAFMALLNEDRAEQWNTASLVLNGISTVMGWLKVIAARHVEAHLAKETGMSVHRFHDDMGETRASQSQTTPKSDSEGDSISETSPSEAATNDTDWISLKPWARCLLSSLSNVSYVSWTIGQPICELFSVVLPIVAGTLGITATQVNSNKKRYTLQIAKIVVDGCATLCAALAHYAITRLETLARQIVKQQKAAAKMNHIP